MPESCDIISILINLSGSGAKFLALLCASRAVITKYGGCERGVLRGKGKRIPAERRGFKSGGEVIDPGKTLF